MQRRVLACVLCFLACAGTEAAAQVKSVPGLGDSANLVLALRRAGFSGSVLQVTAHADDENHGALTYLSRRLGARVGLLTLTHGGAFGNAIDNRVGVALGVLRTQELLAADQYYGVDQFFTRATDSGTVKDGPTALRLWGHEAVLEDVVRVIRFYRPDVIISRWQGNERDGHGHHAAAALLTREAFFAAADPSRFPAHLAEGLASWQVKKLYINSLSADQEATVEIDAGEYDAVLGSSYAELGAQGLSLQRSQVQRVHAWPGPAVYRFQLVESVLPAKQQEDSLFDGLETTLLGLSKLAGDQEQQVPWLRPGLEEVDRHWQIALTSFRANASSEIAPHLFAALDKLQELSGQVAGSVLSPSRRDELVFRLRHKLADFADAAARSLGLRLETFVDPYVEPEKRLVPGVGGLPPGPEFVVPGQKVTVTASLWNRSPWSLQVKDCELKGKSNWMIERLDGDTTELSYNQAASYKFKIHVPEDADYSQPTWERRSYHESLTRHREPVHQLLAKRPPVLVGQCRYRIFGVEASLSAPVRVRTYDRLQGEREEELNVVPALGVEVRPRQAIVPLQAAGQVLAIEVTVQSYIRGTVIGQLLLETPRGWETPPPKPFEFSSPGEKRELHFALSLPETIQPGELKFRAVARANGKEYDVGHDRIAYPELDPEHLYYPAVATVTVVDAEVADGLKVGYVRGRGGDQLMTKVLTWLGVDVHPLEEGEFTLERLREFDTVVLGPFAFGVHPQLRAAIPELTQYVKQGGVVVALPYAVVGPVVAYPIEPRQGAVGWGPYPYRLPGNVFRGVVDAEASVSFLVPDHPLFNSPNQLSPSDFTNWISGLAAGVAEEWDSNYRPMLSLLEKDGREMGGALLVARHGMGFLVHAGLTVHLQLHAGTPGAVRLLANLVSLRKTSKQHVR